MHRFFIEKSDVDGDMAIISGQDARHLVNVLRLGTSDIVGLSDGEGAQYMAEIREATSKKVLLQIVERKFMQGESPVHITVAQSMLKEKKMDVVLRHLTELGIMEWLPFFSDRSVPVPSSAKGKKSDEKVERWVRIARESIKQCGRSVVPRIHEPLSFEEMLHETDSYGEKIAFWEEDSTPVDLLRERREETPPDAGNMNAGRIVIMIGPEGGFTSEEMERAAEAGFHFFSLGSRILRAETAAIAACTLVQNIFGDLGKKSQKILDTPA